MSVERKGMLIVISGPAGAGKGTLGEMLLKSDDSFSFSVSVTTRQPRYYEKEGVHYHFITDAEYDRMIENDELLEYATVHGHRYGTPAAPIKALLESGKSVILDIDPQGAKKVIARAPDCVSVFILPPSMTSLRNRLHTRNTEDEQEIELRLQNARKELEQVGCYRYAVVNGDGPEGKQKAFETLCTILEAEKQNTCRYKPVIQE